MLQFIGLSDNEWFHIVAFRFCHIGSGNMTVSRICVSKPLRIELFFSEVRVYCRGPNQRFLFLHPPFSLDTLFISAFVSHVTILSCSFFLIFLSCGFVLIAKWANRTLWICPNNHISLENPQTVCFCGLRGRRDVYDWTPKRLIQFPHTHTLALTLALTLTCTLTTHHTHSSTLLPATTKIAEITHNMYRNFSLTFHFINVQCVYLVSFQFVIWLFIFSFCFLFFSFFRRKKTNAFMHFLFEM